MNRTQASTKPAAGRGGGLVVLHVPSLVPEKDAKQTLENGVTLSFVVWRGVSRNGASAACQLEPSEPSVFKVVLTCPTRSVAFDSIPKEWTVEVRPSHVSVAHTYSSDWPSPSGPGSIVLIVRLLS